MRTFKYIALAAIGLCFAACEKDDITPSAQNSSDAVRVNATIGNIQTRTVMDGEGVTFADGDMIFVQNLTRSTENTAVYTKTTTEWTTSDNLLWATGTNKFKAVYPHLASFTSYTIPADQQSGLNSIDWMIAETGEVTKPEDKTINLVFEHQLAMVTVDILEVADEFSYYPVTAEAGLFYPNEVNPENIHIIFGGSSVTASMIGKNQDLALATQEWSALLRPGKYAAGSTFMDIVTSGPTLSVKASDLLVNEGLKAGNHYHFKIKIGKDMVIVDQVDVIPWDVVEVDGGIAMNVMTVDGVAATGFDEGQVLTVLGTVNGANVSAEYTYTSGKWEAVTPFVVKDLDDLTAISAWVGYPSSSVDRSSAITSNDYLTDVANAICDQSTGLIPFDWMISKTGIDLPTKANNVLNLNLSHVMAKVTLNNITYSSDFETVPTLTELYFISRPCLSYDIATDNFATGSQNGVDYAKVIPYQQSATSYSALLMPNSSEGVSETLIMTIKVNGIDQEVKMPGALEAGKHYTFELNISTEEAVLVPVDTDLGWNDEVEL